MLRENENMLEGRFEGQDSERNKEELEAIGWAHESKKNRVM